MSLTTISVAPETNEDAAAFSFAHMRSHQDIVRVIFQNYSVNLTVFSLDPADLTSTWVLNHQTMHNQMNQVLGIQGQNLTLVDWNDSESVLEWVNDNFSEHQQACQKLNLG